MRPVGSLPPSKPPTGPAPPRRSVCAPAAMSPRKGRTNHVTPPLAAEPPIRPRTGPGRNVVKPARDFHRLQSGAEGSVGGNLTGAGMFPKIAAVAEAFGEIADDAFAGYVEQWFDLRIVHARVAV